MTMPDPHDREALIDIARSVGCDLTYHERKQLRGDGYRDLLATVHRRWRIRIGILVAFILVGSLTRGVAFLGAEWASPLTMWMNLVSGVVLIAVLCISIVRYRRALGTVTQFMAADDVSDGSTCGSNGPS